MELILNRYERDMVSTLGKLSNENGFICYTLEDTDRGLTDAMRSFEIRAKKINGKTAIPMGRYEINCTMSPRFKRVLPQLLSVKGFSGIRIHPGNTSADTEGCILVGTSYVNIGIHGHSLVESRKAFDNLYNIIGQALLKERVFITITR